MSRVPWRSSRRWSSECLAIAVDCLRLRRRLSTACSSSHGLLRLRELLHGAVELRDVDVAAVADGDAVPSGDSRSVQFSEDGAVQVPQDSTGPDFLVLRDREPGDPAGAGPLGEERAVRVEHFDALIVAIGDVDASLAVDHQVMGEPELAGPRASPAPL